MKNCTDHTDRVKDRITAIAIEPQDSCTFFQKSVEATKMEAQCGNCFWSAFRTETSETSEEKVADKGLCKFAIKEWQEVERELVKAKEIYEVFVSNMNGGAITCIFDTKTQSSKPIYVNEGWSVITGYTLEELEQEMGGNPQALILPGDKANMDVIYMEQIQRGKNYDLSYRLTRKDGEMIWVIDRGITTVLENGLIQNQSVIIDVTEIKMREESLTRLSQTDQLTELNNKATAAMLIQGMLERYPDQRHAIMVMDIDNFKGINDSRGHAFGDMVLRSVSDCLKSLFRNMDILGRIGGDEFMVLMAGITSLEQVEKKAEDVCKGMRNLQTTQKGYPPTSVSIGISIFSGESDYQQLYEQADIALYDAKKNGKDQYCIYKG